MKYSVLVKPGSKIDSVEKLDTTFIIRTKARAVDGKANEAVTKLFAAYLGVPKTHVRLTHGIAGKNKILEVD